MIPIREQLRFLASLFAGAGHILYVTGGYVRDYLLYGTADKTDIDICSNMSVKNLKDLLAGTGFRTAERNSALGTVAIVGEGEAYEYTAFRRESYRSGHSPESVSFVSTVEEDALRRDFTVNSIYYDIVNQKIVDPLNGVGDLEVKLLRTADSPMTTFSCDGLRLIRLVRFACQHGLIPEKATKSAAKQMSPLIADISRTRINEEFFKILLTPDGDKAYKGLKLLKELGLLFFIIPELRPLEGFAQNKRWHEFDVLEHMLQTVRYCSADTRMAGLLHDIGKPESENTFGKSAFHTEIALRIVPQILKDFGYSQRRAARVLRLIEHHMYDGNCETGINKVKRFILNNLDIFDDLLILKQADYLAKGKDVGTCPTVTKWKEIFGDLLKGGVLETSDLALTPVRLIAELEGIMPVADTAAVLKKLLEAVAIEGISNDCETLIRRAKSFY